MKKNYWRIKVLENRINFYTQKLVIALKPQNYVRIILWNIEVSST